MDAQELLLTAARALAVYVLMLVVIRALGRRTVGNFSAFDLLVALMLGEVVDELIYGDVRFIQGVVAIVTLGVIAFADSLLSDRGSAVLSLRFVRERGLWTVRELPVPVLALDARAIR